MAHKRTLSRAGGDEPVISMREALEQRKLRLLRELAGVEGDLRAMSPAAALATPGRGRNALAPASRGAANGSAASVQSRSPPRSAASARTLAWAREAAATVAPLLATQMRDTCTGAQSQLDSRGVARAMGFVSPPARSTTQEAWASPHEGRGADLVAHLLAVPEGEAPRRHHRQRGEMTAYLRACLRQQVNVKASGHH